MIKSAFIFDDVCILPERQIDKHSHECWELSYIICGTGFRTIGDLTESFIQGEIILIPPGIPHVWKFDSSVTDISGNISNISVFFDASLLAAMKVLFPEMVATLTKIESLSQAVNYTGKAYDTILNLLNEMRGLTPEKRCPKMMELLISLSDTTESMYTGRNNKMNRTKQKLEKVRIYCACNYAKEISLDEISCHVGMNKSAFCTFMRHNTGFTFSEYINHIRLERAKEKLCHTDCRIAEIALDCGFQNATYFNRIFKKTYGMSPSQFKATRS